jgi:hypothetical protein
MTRTREDDEADGVVRLPKAKMEWPATLLLKKKKKTLNNNLLLFLLQGHVS